MVVKLRLICVIIAIRFLFPQWMMLTFPIFKWKFPKSRSCISTTTENFFEKTKVF